MNRVAASMGFFATVLVGGLLVSRGAGAVGTLASGVPRPLEQRVALAVGPDRTTLWTSVRADSGGGALGVVVPAPPGASLDWSSAAWFEALETATAPRVIAPPLTCRGAPPVAQIHIAGETAHEVPLAAGSAAILAGAADVAAWAGSNGLTLTPELSDAIATFSGVRFVAVRFDVPPGTVLTPTLRVVSPSPVPELPLVLTRAGDEELLVTTFVLGEGRAHIDGAPVAALNLSDLSFHAARGVSTYDEARALALLSAGPGSTLIEAASHGALAGSTPIPNSSISGLADVYFERASAYGDAQGDPATCVSRAAEVIAGAAPISASCPRAELGVVDGAPACTEAVAAGEADPALLRCGSGADDIAVALSGQAPSASWLTRQSLIIPSGGSGARVAVSLTQGPEESPVIEARSLVCEVPLRRVESSGCSCAGTAEAVIVGVVEVLVEDENDQPPESYSQEEDCEGDTSDTYASDTEGEPLEGEDPDGDGCSGDSSDTGAGEGGSDTAAPEDDGGCGGDTSDTGEGAEDDGGCSGDTSDTGGGGGDGSSSGSGGGEGSDSSESCDCGGTSGGGDCAVASPRKQVKRVRLSVLAFAGLALIAPLRRALRPRRRRRTV